MVNVKVGVIAHNYYIEPRLINYLSRCFMFISYHNISMIQNQHPNTSYSPSNLLAYTGLDRAFFPNRNQRVPSQIIAQDQEKGVDTQSLKYLRGEKYVQESCAWLSFPKICQRLSTLQSYHQHQSLIRGFEREILLLRLDIHRCKLGCSVPVRKKRAGASCLQRVWSILRHYLYAAAVPITLAYYSSHNAVVNQVNNLWSIHANRLNNKILDDSFGTLQVPISRDFKVNIYKSVIPQEIDIQENINARLSIAELGDSGLEDFEFEKYTPEAAEGGEESGQDAGDDNEESNTVYKAETAENGSAESTEQIQQTEQPEAREIAAEEREEAPVVEIQTVQKIKLSELDLDNLDIDSINLDQLDLSELGLDIEDDS